MKRAISIAAVITAGLLPAVTIAGGRSQPPPAMIHIESDAGAAPSTLTSFGTVTGSSCDPGGCQVGGQFGSASASAALALSAVGLATYDSNQVNPLAIAYAQVTYYYQVVGPATLVVPLKITGSVSASAGGWGLGQADILGTGFSPVEACVSPAAPAQCFYGEMGAATLDATFNLTANTVASVTMDAEGLVGDYQTPDLGSYSAHADPMITIDPAFLAQNPSYRLVFSPNLTSSVPEPGGWALMLVGFGGLGAAMRGSRRKVALTVGR